MPDFDMNTVLAGFLKDLQAGALGTAWPLTSLRIGTNPASTGAIRLANGDWIKWRNNANSADLSIIRGTTADTVEIAATIESGALRPYTGFSDTYAIGTSSLRYTTAFLNTTSLKPVAFASLPAGIEGMVASVNDSNTNVWGATVAAGGANKVLVYFNGTVWTVAGK